MSNRSPQSHRLRMHRYSVSGNCYFITTCCDRRRPVLLDRDLARAVVDEIAGMDRSGLTRTVAYVVMPDHLHWLFYLAGTAQLSTTVQRLKGRAARSLNCLRGCTGRVWQPGYLERRLRTEAEVESTGNYIIANPVRAGLVSDPDDFEFWDTAWHRRGRLAHAGNHELNG